MKRSTAFFFVIALAALGMASQMAPVTYTMTPESRLWIEGTSSLHDWTCDVAAPNGTVQADFSAAQLLGTTLSVAVRDIECHKGTMNKKTYAALQDDAHPTITYTLDTAQLAPMENDTFTATTTGRLTVAGVERTVEMAVSGEMLEDGRVRFTGQLPLLMTDFDIKPPTALLGTLKTGDAVTIHFDVIAAR